MGIDSDAAKNPPQFGGLRVAALESRRAAETARLIERHGGTPFVSPSMCEVPLANNPAAVEFAQLLMTGQIDVVVLMTGVGTSHLIAQVERHIDRQRFLDALSDVKTVVRGPKPTAVLKELGVSPTIRVPEPNTWRELLSTLDAELPVANLTVAVQEYGVPNPSLVAGLEARGGRVLSVRVYEWGLPDELGPLEENVRRIAAGDVDLLLFTSGNQVTNLLKIAENLEQVEAMRESLRTTVVASIGPTTSEVLRSQELPVDFQPSRPKLAQFIREAAESSGELLQRKRRVAEVVASLEVRDRAAGSVPAWNDSPFLRACRLQPTEYTPVWLMRQAGRYMPEYRAVRKDISFLELCRNPQLSSEVMCTAVEQLGVDAAIIFSDLLPILEPMGMELEFTKGDGPVIHNPVREPTDVDRVAELEGIDALHFVVETVQQTRKDLPARLPLIGFAGAPFTLASYAIEGGSSRNYLFTKTLMHRDPRAWDELMQRMVRSLILYLNAQIAAGAQVVQLFDSWVGCLGPDDYRGRVLPYVQEIVRGVQPAAPVIYFATGNPALLRAMRESGAAVVGVDWRTRLDDAWTAIGYEHAIQGNLDPALLLAEEAAIRTAAESILDQAAGRPGHIFNLGHGVLPQTPPANARLLVDAVHELSRDR